MVQHSATCLIYICTCKKSDMKITLIIIALFQLSFLGCATKDSKQDLEPTAKDASSTPKSDNPISDSEVGGVIKLIPDEYYTTKEEREFIKRAEPKVNEVKNSDCMHKFLADRKMIQRGDRTNEQVADHIRSISGSVDVIMYYRKFTSAMAYREPPSLKINLNRKYFSTSLPVCDWVNTLLHESVGHALGNYDHDFNYSSSRDYSVPYSLGFGSDKCCLN